MNCPRVARFVDVARRWRRAVRGAPGRLRRFRRLDPVERRITLHALVTLLVVEASVRWMPLPRLARALGVGFEPQLQGRWGTSEPERTSDDASSPPLVPAEADLLGPVARARRSTYRVVSVWPFGAGPCLRESLVLGHLVRDCDPMLRLGVTRDGSRIRAHAWVEVDDRPVNDPMGFAVTSRGGRR